MGSQHHGIGSALSCTLFIKLHDESVESVLTIPIRMRVSSRGLMEILTRLQLTTPTHCYTGYPVVISTGPL